MLNPAIKGSLLVKYSATASFICCSTVAESSTSNPVTVTSNTRLVIGKELTSAPAGLLLAKPF